MKKLLAVILVTVLAVTSVFADKISRTYVALLNPDGTYQYAVAGTDPWVRITDTQTGNYHEYTWNDVKQNPEKTTYKVEEYKDVNTVTHTSTYGLQYVTEFKGIQNCGDYAVLYNAVVVIYNGRYNGTGIVFSILMKDNLDEKACVEGCLMATSKEVAAVAQTKQKQKTYNK